MTDDGIYGGSLRPSEVKDGQAHLYSLELKSEKIEFSIGGSRKSISRDSSIQLRAPPAFPTDSQ
uniref:Uncharacterized protein n=1 Tax=Coccidioides posadasii RMSCC 3488 TaxID=454284 RepID=A0A0J6FMD0_COCPO|nr:hypothetical protein CPAG_07845 [Coccidioides posadasii RMSCC 3488]